MSRLLGQKLGAAGIGLVLLTAVGCGNDGAGGAPFAAEETGQDEPVAEQTEQIPLPDLSGQQVCDLLSPETLAKHVPDPETSNGTVESTEQVSKARCESTVATSGAQNRRLVVEVHTGVPTTPGEEPVEGVTTVESAKDWLDAERETAEVEHEEGEVNGRTQEAPEDLAGVGDEAFTQFSLSTDGTTGADGYFRSGIWGVQINYDGYDRPNPDDRDNKQYLPKEVLVAAIAEIGTEIDGNLAALSGGSGEPTGTPGELTGDALCAALSDELIERYLPNVKDSANSNPGEGSARASCEWLSAEPRTDAPGLRHRDGRTTVTVFELRAADTFAENKQSAQEAHAAGPDPKEGPGKGTTHTALQDVPDLGLAAWIQLSHAGPGSAGTIAGLHILLPGERIARVTYGGHDSAELDTESTEAGESVPLPDEEVTAAVLAMAKEILAVVG